MKGFITIVAASAVLSAALVAGRASADATPAPSAWIDPPAKPAAACRDAAWPYRPATCATEAPVRKVRVIAVDGTGAPGAVALR